MYYVFRNVELDTLFISLLVFTTEDTELHRVTLLWRIIQYINFSSVFLCILCGVIHYLLFTSSKFFIASLSPCPAAFCHHTLASSCSPLCQSRQARLFQVKGSLAVRSR